MTMESRTYEAFKLAVYCTAGCLDKPLSEIDADVDLLQQHLRLSKVYIENHRCDVSLSRERLPELKALFEARGIETAGGITPTPGAAYRPGYERLFGGICYTDEASRAKFKEGLELMTEVSERLIMQTAREVNPKSRMIIKYPNWNEAYAASGYNTATQPALFDGIYTGTETRDPAISQQHIPRRILSNRIEPNRVEKASLLFSPRIRSHLVRGSSFCLTESPSAPSITHRGWGILDGTPTTKGGPYSSMTKRMRGRAIGAARAGLLVFMLIVSGWTAWPARAGVAAAADTTYHKWSLMAIAETKRKYPDAALVDYLHIGRTQLGNGLSEEKFKLWLRRENREFGVYVTVRFHDEEDRLVSIATRESES